MSEEPLIKMPDSTKKLVKDLTVDYERMVEDIIRLRQTIRLILNSNSYDDVEDIDDLFDAVRNLDEQLAQECTMDKDETN